MTAPLLPDPVLLDPPPGDPRALTDLAGRLVRAGASLGELGEQVSADAGAVPSWTGRDAAAAGDRLHRAGGLVRDAAAALDRAGARLALHADLLDDARHRLARLRRVQEEDFGAAALRLGAQTDPGTSGALEELRSNEAARRLVAAAIRQEVERDATATAVVLEECGAVEGRRPEDREALLRTLADLLPGWREFQLAERGREFAAAVRGGDVLDRETAARALLPWAGEGAVAAAVLTGLGRAGFRDVLHQLGDGSLSAGSALARAMAAVLGAPVPLADAADVARVRDGRFVDPGDAASIDGDLVALGMGVLLAAGRGDRRAGPPAATVLDWGRQLVARERAMGAERIVDRIRLGPAPSPPGDPLEEVLVRLAGEVGPGPAAGLLRAEPTWSHLLQRPWDDGGAALAALAGRAAEQPGGPAVRSGLRALGAGLGDDGDPAGWTVDRATAAVVGPALARAVAAGPAVVVDPLARAATGADEDRVLLRGLGYLTIDPEVAAVLDRAVAEAVGRNADAAPTAPPVPVVAGYLAVREYGQRLAHTLTEFTAQERAVHRAYAGDLLTAAAMGFIGPFAAVATVAWDLDGTWDAGADLGRRFSEQDAARAGGGDGAAAYREVAAVLGTPDPPESPPVDVFELLSGLVPGGGALRDRIEQLGGAASELVQDAGEGHEEPPVDD